jgi:hypothetical protein
MLAEHDGHTAQLVGLVNQEYSPLTLRCGWVTQDVRRNDLGVRLLKLVPERVHHLAEDIAPPQGSEGRQVCRPDPRQPGACLIEACVDGKETLGFGLPLSA